MKFTDEVRSLEELRELLPEPKPTTVQKIRPSLDPFSRQFIERSPFCVIASRNAQGAMDVSPKGDPPGFVRVLDDSTFAIPDRPGNGIADTLLNIIECPDVAVIFLAPGKGETLRVNGRARVVRDRDLLESLAHNGKTPVLATVISVETVFFHCAKCIIRSGLWRPDDWRSVDDLPSLGKVLQGQLESDIDSETLDARIQESYRDKLY